VHAFYEVGRSKEHTPKTPVDLPVADPDGVVKDQGPEILTYLSFVPVEPQNQVVIHKDDIDLLSKSVVLKGRVSKFFQIVHHPGPFGVLVNVPDRSQVVLVSVDNTRSVPVTP